MRNNGTRPHTGHIRLRGREYVRAEKPSPFLETTKEILSDEEEKEGKQKRERDERGGKEWDGSATESASSRDRAETR